MCVFFCGPNRQRDKCVFISISAVRREAERERRSRHQRTSRLYKTRSRVEWRSSTAAPRLDGTTELCAWNHEPDPRRVPLTITRHPERLDRSGASRGSKGQTSVFDPFFPSCSSQDVHRHSFFLKKQTTSLNILKHPSSFYSLSLA